ncbi:MAG: hypothetical protein E6J08_09460 [Chloroflexi bacterium]|nr:MAG: hypothetical protein E6J08_09460 [Chloroflexota bacterium]
MGHLDTQRSLPVIGADKTGLSPLAKKLRLAAQHTVAVLNAPDGYLAQLNPGPPDINTALQPDQAYDAVLLQTRGATDLPATPWWVQRDVLGEITSETGYKPVAFVAIDSVWTALRFKRL